MTGVGAGVPVPCDRSRWGREGASDPEGTDPKGPAIIRVNIGRFRGRGMGEPTGPPKPPVS